MKKEVKALEKKISEAKIDVGLPLYNAICDSIETLSKEKNNENIKEVLTVMMAEFQADSVIANRTINHINDLVFSSASDQAVHTGSDCCCIRNFCMKEKNYKTTLESCSIFCSNEESIKTSQPTPAVIKLRSLGSCNNSKIGYFGFTICDELNGKLTVAHTFFIDSSFEQKIEQLSNVVL